MEGVFESRFFLDLLFCCRRNPHSKRVRMCDIQPSSFLPTLPVSTAIIVYSCCWSCVYITAVGQKKIEITFKPLNRVTTYTPYSISCFPFPSVKRDPKFFVCKAGWLAQAVLIVIDLIEDGIVTRSPTQPAALLPILPPDFPQPGGMTDGP